jgi:HK97 family phage major capsid protein
VKRIETHDNRADDPQRGFSSFGEFASAAIAASLYRQRDERLMIGAAAPGTLGTEGTGTDGGFAVPPAWNDQIYTDGILREENLLGYCDTTPIESNSMIFPTDEATPWGTNGVRAYWQAEAVAATATKPVLREVTLRHNKLIALVPLSNELAGDTTALNDYLPGGIGKSIAWKCNEAILLGKGNGQPLGALGSGATVTVAKDAGQATLTVSLANLSNMISRLPPGSFGNAVWLVSPDAIPAFIGASPAGYPMVPAPAKADGSPSSLIGLMLGRPAIANQHAAAFSSQGDICLVDLTAYRAITRNSGPDTQMSIHFYFDSDVITCRTTFRVDGAPKISAPLAQAKGSNTLSPFVQLAAR